MRGIIENIVNGKAFERLYTGFKFDNPLIQDLERLLNVLLATFFIVATYHFFSFERLLIYFHSDIISNIKTDTFGMWSIYFGYILIVVPLCSAFAGYLLPIIMLIAMISGKKWYPSSFDKLLPSYNGIVIKSIITMGFLQTDFFSSLSGGAQVMILLMFLLISIVPLRFKIINAEVEYTK